MSAGPTREPVDRLESASDVTLLDLVQAVSEAATSETEVVATVLSMLRSGRVHLRGSFRDSLLPDA